MILLSDFKFLCFLVRAFNRIVGYCFFPVTDKPILVLQAYVLASATKYRVKQILTKVGPILEISNLYKSCIIKINLCIINVKLCDGWVGETMEKEREGKERGRKEDPVCIFQFSLE